MPTPYDPDKLADATLALLGAFEFDNGRAWKRHDFDVMDRLHAEGMISNPRNRYESVHLTPEGLKRAKALADAWFGASPPTPRTNESLSSLANLGPKSAAFLTAAGIHSVEELASLGSVAAFAKVKQVEPKASLNLLWALEGALTGISWQEVAREHRTSLLLALETHERNT